MGTLDFILTYTKIKSFLGDSSLQMALVNRKTETEAFFISVFGNEWRGSYKAFVAKVTEYREKGLACVPLLALGYQVPELPLESVFLVSQKVLDYRKGIRPLTTQEKLSKMMARASRSR